MLTSLAIFALLAGVGVFFASAKHAVCLRWLLLGSVIVCVVGGYVLKFAPRDYLIRYRWAEPVFHPWRMALWLFPALMACCSLSSGLFMRCLVNGFRRWRQRR